MEGLDELFKGEFHRLRIGCTFFLINNSPWILTWQLGGRGLYGIKGIR